MPVIRPGSDADLPQIASIYAHHVMHGTGTFELDPPSPEDMARRRADVVALGLPYLVVEQAGVVAGFAYCSHFRPRPAYRFAAEDSIYMAPCSQRQGLGLPLLAELIAAAERADMRRMVAVIGDSSNLGSIALHLAAGFRHAGLLHACGWKFGRWLDVVMMERPLGPGANMPAA